MSTFVNWVIDFLASDDVIDLYFILSDLVDIPISDLEKQEWGENDCLSEIQSRGYYINSNYHVIAPDGRDCGPVGKCVL